MVVFLGELLVMGTCKFFHVDSKSYEITWVGNPNGLNIIERGRNHMSNVFIGREGARWFQTALKDVASLPSDH